MVIILCEKENIMEENGKLSIFLTGATTFIGRYVTRRLVAAGHTVTGMTTGSKGANQVRADGGLPVYADPLRSGEIKSMLTMAQADVVVHVAPQIYNQIPHYKAAWDERDVQVNDVALSTQAILEAAQAAEVKFFVHTGYAFLYGNTGDHWVDEEAPLHAPGDSPFFKAARFAEDAVRNSSIPSSILRLGFAYGDTSDALHNIADNLRRGRAVLTGSADTQANWIYAEDAAQAIALATIQQKAGEVFNIVGDTPVSPANFVNTLAETLGLAHPGRPMLPLLRPSALQSALLDCSLRVRNDKAKADLGWTPKFATVREGIEQTLMNWRAEEPVLA